MEKARRLAKGQLSELFGKDTLAIDKFMRAAGLNMLAQESFEVLSETEKRILRAYADGINDFVRNVDFIATESSARLLPLEFYVFGIK